MQYLSAKKEAARRLSRFISRLRQRAELWYLTPRKNSGDGLPRYQAFLNSKKQSRKNPASSSGDRNTNVKFLNRGNRSRIGFLRAMISRSLKGGINSATI